MQVEALRRQDSSQRLRQVEEELADARAELQGVREREGQAREAEREARQTAAKAEDKSSQLKQQLAKVRMFNHLMWGETLLMMYILTWLVSLGETILSLKMISIISALFFVKCDLIACLQYLVRSISTEIGSCQRGGVPGRAPGGHAH